MDLAKLIRKAEFRAAVVSVLVGLWMLLQTILAHLEGLGGAAWIFGVPALLFLGLAVPVYRGSDEAALAVVGIFLLLMLITVLAGGLRALFPWPAIMAAMLWAGMHGVFAQSAGPTRLRVRRR
jgi:hypothetical protein